MIHGRCGHSWRGSWGYWLMERGRSEVKRILLDMEWLIEDAMAFLDQWYREGKLSAQDYIDSVNALHNEGVVRLTIVAKEITQDKV